MERRIRKNDEVKKITFEILKFFDKFCEENELRYSLAYGTLLGAERHKGYIPWDDDIDVIMPRKDYEKLIKLSDSWNGQYKFICTEKTMDYNMPFGKIVDTNTYVKNQGKVHIEDLGLFIDVFAADGIGNTKLMSICRVLYMYWLTCHLLDTLFNGAEKYKGIRRFIQKKFDKLGCKKIYTIMKKLTIRHDFYKTKYVVVFGESNHIRGIFRREIYSELEKIPFEGQMFSASKHRKKYLSAIYGNYMELPPKNKRIPTHNMDVWIRE